MEKHIADEDLTMEELYHVGGNDQSDAPEHDHDLYQQLSEDAATQESHPLLGITDDRPFPRVPRSWAHAPTEKMPSIQLRSATTNIFAAAGIAPPTIDRGSSKTNFLREPLEIVLFIYRGIGFCLSWHCFFMILVSVFAIFLCAPVVLNLRFDTSIPIFSYGIVTPLTFGIGTSFQSRDDVVASLGRIKALTISLFMYGSFPP